MPHSELLFSQCPAGMVTSLFFDCIIIDSWLLPASARRPSSIRKTVSRPTSFVATRSTFPNHCLGSRPSHAAFFPRRTILLGPALYDAKTIRVLNQRTSQAVTIPRGSVRFSFRPLPCSTRSPSRLLPRLCQSLCRRLSLHRRSIRRSSLCHRQSSRRLSWYLCRIS